MEEEGEKYAEHNVKFAAPGPCHVPDITDIGILRVSKAKSEVLALNCEP